MSMGVPHKGVLLNLRTRRRSPRASKYFLQIEAGSLASNEAEKLNTDLSETGVFTSWRKPARMHKPEITIGFTLLILVFLELLVSGYSELQEILFIGYFFPIALGARYFSRKKTIYITLLSTCLLYTSDAADDLTRVDLGGRRIIK